MEKKMLYHGSNVVVEKPKILINGFYKDFGYGFYCTYFELWILLPTLHHKNVHHSQQEGLCIYDRID